MKSKTFKNILVLLVVMFLFLGSFSISFMSPTLVNAQLWPADDSGWLDGNAPNNNVPSNSTGDIGGNPTGDIGGDPPIDTTDTVPTNSGTPVLQNPLSGDIRSLEGLLNLILTSIVIPVGSIVIVFMIIYCGFLFVTARGNEGQIEKAREMLLWVVIGAAILLGAVAITGIISGTVCQILPDLGNCA